MWQSVVRPQWPAMLWNQCQCPRSSVRNLDIASITDVTNGKQYSESGNSLRGGMQISSCDQRWVSERTLKGIVTGLSGASCPRVNALLLICSLGYGDFLFFYQFFTHHYSTYLSRWMAGTVPRIWTDFRFSIGSHSKNTDHCCNAWIARNLTESWFFVVVFLELRTES